MQPRNALTPDETMDFSHEFYSANASRYRQVSQERLQSRFLWSSHPKLEGDWDLVRWLVDLAPGPVGLDVGCGAEGRDVFRLRQQLLEVCGIDLVPEVLREAGATHPEVAGYLALADLRYGLPFRSRAFDFVLCNAVIQHLEPLLVHEVVLPEFSRVLRPGGVVLLSFKPGTGILRIFDPHYKAIRHYRLHLEERLLAVARRVGLAPVPELEGIEGAVLYYGDGKGVSHSAVYLIKGHHIKAL